MSTVAMPIDARSQQFRQWRDIGLITGLVLCSGLVTVASLPGPAAGPAAPLAVIFPPWVSGEEAMMRSLATGARLLRQGAMPFVVVVAPEAATVPAARPVGAMLMLRLDGLAGCIISSEAEATRL